VAGQFRLRAEDGDVRSFVVGLRPGFEVTRADNPFGLDVWPRSGEIVVSDITMRQGGLEIGDALTVGEHQFEVIGTVSEDIGFRGFSFLDFEDAQSLLAEPGVTNYFTVFLDGSSEKDTIAEAMKAQFPAVDVFTQEQFAASSREEMSSFNPILAVLTVVSFIVGAAVISLTIYTTTIEKAREYGVMKAVGASGGQLYRIVLSQSLAVGIIGFAVGVPLAIVAGDVISRFVPEFVTVYHWEAILGIFAGVLVMSLVASYLPARTIANVDPAMVFRA
jgi:putative ABC transport system permease protein